MPTAPDTRIKAFEGWRLLCLLAALITLGTLALVFLAGGDVAAVRLAIRNTARSSLLLFLLAFGASALHRVWRGAWTGWLLRNRRYLGLGFVVSHLTHAAVVASFAVMAPAQFHELTQPAAFILGGTTYVFILLLAATSFDRTAAWLGPRRWRVLHLVGTHMIWLNFLISEGRRAPQDPRYWGFVVPLLAVMALRLYARRARARRPLAAQ